MKKNNEEFRRFDDAMTQLLKVPHNEIKERLDAEKADKKKRKPKASASHASDAKG